MNNHIRNYNTLGQFFEESVNFSKSSSQHEIGVSQSAGTHLYSDLRVTHNLSSSNLLEERKQSMDVIRELGIIAIEAATLFEARLLEHQGQRLHIFVEGNSENSLKQAYASALYIDREARKRIQPMIPSKWKSFASSMSWGNTVFLKATDLHGDDSIISLAHAANAPAKVLPKLNDKDIAIVKGELGGHTQRQTISEDFHMMAKTASANILFNRALPEVEVHFSANKNLILARKQSNFPSSQQSDSEQRSYFSYVFRADLDGFTNAVLEAQQNQTKLNSLISDFIDLVKKANSFAHEHLQEFIQLPWAGDCYSLIVTSENIEKYRSSLNESNVNLCIDFDKNVAPSNYLKQSNLTGWAYSLAGGDAHGSQLGNSIVGRLTLDGRSFIVATSKGVRRSLDGFDQTDVDCGEIALFSEDKKHLINSYQSLFKPHNSNFHTSSTKETSNVKVALALTAPLPSSSTSLPAVSNHHNGI